MNWKHNSQLKDLIRLVSPKGPQKYSNLMCTFWDLPLEKVREVIQNEPRLADLVILLMRFKNSGVVLH